MKYRIIATQYHSFVVDLRTETDQGVYFTIGTVLGAGFTHRVEAGILVKTFIPRVDVISVGRVGIDLKFKMKFLILILSILLKN